MKSSVILAFACCIFLPVERANALGDQWYIGIGGGGSFLQPNPDLPGLNTSDELGTGGVFFFGRDLDDRSSAQFTFYSLGEATLDNDETVTYNAADASVLYRIFDSKDRRIARSGVSIAFYGRFALGFLDRETDVLLSDDSDVYFGAGGGAELFLSNNISLRLEGMYHDQDASSGSLQLVGRFGGARGLQARPIPTPQPPPPSGLPTPSTPSVTAPSLPVPDIPAAPTVPVPSIPATPAAPIARSSTDNDGDGVQNAQDQCPASAAGFPVRQTGCALFDGVLSGVTFATGTAELVPGATDQLDFLANVLAQYPQAKVELHAHTDDGGTVRDQAILTRARLRTIGTYLVSKGVRSNRLVLRSFGGTRPLYNNSSAEGQTGNNRIEVIESRTQ